MAGTARRFSDGSLKLTGVQDKTDPSAPVAVETATTVVGQLYDAVRRSRVIADLGAAGVELFVEDTSNFLVSDSVELRLDDTTTLHATTLSAVDDAAGTVTLAAGIPAGRTAKQGTWLQKPIGSQFDMNSPYGTAASAGDNDAGFIGFYDDDIDLFNVAWVRGEVDFNGGAGKRLFKAETFQVVTED